MVATRNQFQMSLGASAYPPPVPTATHVRYSLSITLQTVIGNPVANQAYYFGTNPSGGSPGFFPVTFGFSYQADIPDERGFGIGPLVICASSRSLNLLPIATYQYQYIKDTQTPSASVTIAPT